MVEEVLTEYSLMGAKFQNQNQNQNHNHNQNQNQNWIYSQSQMRMTDNQSPFSLSSPPSSSPFSSMITRTLFVRNLSRSSFYEDIFLSLSTFGSIADLDARHLLSEGFVVVTYHDIRDSHSAFRQIGYVLPSAYPHLSLPNTNIGVHYFVNVSPESIQNDGILLIEFFGLHLNDLKTLCTHFGEIRRILLIDESTVLVEYYDTRDAERAQISLNGEILSGSKLFVSFVNGNTSWEVAGFGNSSFHTSSATIASILPMCLPFNQTSPFASPKTTPPSSPNSSPLSSYQTSPKKEQKDVSQRRNMIGSYSKNLSLFSNDQSEEDQMKLFHETAFKQLSQIAQESQMKSTQQIQIQPQQIQIQPQQIQIQPQQIQIQPQQHIQIQPQPQPTQIQPQQQIQIQPQQQIQIQQSQHMQHSSTNNQSNITNHSHSQSHSHSHGDKFQIELEAISKGIDKRTTLMIRNIPNKYTQDMILEFLDADHKGTYDFIYLPIDFKNKCNVGYAFINFINPISIVSFTKCAHGKKWTRFNSEKICQLSYARIQGKENLIRHFQNSTIMSEDKTYQPKVFHSSGPLIGQEMRFPDPFASSIEKKM